MRDLAELRFIADRVRAEIAANPSVGPFLGERPRARVAACREGHPLEQVGRQQRCRVCSAARKRARYAESRRTA